MLTFYFSGTGNTRYLAQRFSRQMDANCISIEEAADCTHEILQHAVIAFCYPIYGSRPPKPMREFVARHCEALRGKSVVIFVTQMMFSGDGARALLESLPRDHVDVIYAEHFNMPDNVPNLWPLFREKSVRTRLRMKARVDKKLSEACVAIQAGVRRKRGFAPGSRTLGALQGKPWLLFAERLMGNRLKIHNACNLCGLCVTICPRKNLTQRANQIVPLQDCVVCYRCVNRCPRRAITIFFHQKPKWQYYLSEESSWEKS